MKNSKQVNKKQLTKISGIERSKIKGGSNAYSNAYVIPGGQVCP